jgi:hypothetical protein
MEWQRGEMAFATDRYGALFSEVVPSLLLRSRQPAGPLRLGVWAGDARVHGWSLPWLPANAMLTIEGRTATGLANGVRRVLAGFLRDWSGGWPRPVTLPHGAYRLTLDQHPDRAVEVFVEVMLTASE